MFRHVDEILLYHWVRPFGLYSYVQPIAVGYPEQISRTNGTRWWRIYFFGASLFFALLFGTILNMRL